MKCFGFLNPENKNVGKFYQLFKVHKKHQLPELPPGRPIISGCGSITEKISAFVDHHAKELVTELPSYIQDTPDLLRHLEDLNKETIPDGAFPVSIDVVGLYSNIPHQEGLDCLKEALNTRTDQSVSTNFLITLMSLVLMWNLFEFDMQLFIQIIGTAMGTIAAPTFACLFMGRMDILIRACALIGTETFIFFYKRFIDDILVIWSGTEEEFKSFILCVPQ